MKKMLLLVLICVLIFSCVGCSPYEPLFKLEYKGTPLSYLTYKTIDYMGGGSSTGVFDFENNVVTRTTFNPYDEQNPTETREICRFTEEEEKTFINAIYSAGLFGIKDSYSHTGDVMDGGGWDLEIKFSDGTVKRSTGDNAGPDRVFKYCAIAAYDLTGEQIMGNVPTAYYSPPRLDVGIGYEYTYKNFRYVGGPDPDEKRVNYSWNGHVESNLDLYTVATEGKSALLIDEEYTLSISTINYHNYNGKYEKFSRCVVKSYDLDPSLGGEKILFEGKWFDSVKIPYEPNRIYLITLYFSDGDYVEYAFNTSVLDQKIHYGQYRYNIYNVGKSVLKINPDSTFSLDPFDYFDESNRKPGEAKESLCGTWGFEILDGEDYLVLTAESGERLVFVYCASGIFLENERTTLNLEKYHLEGDMEAMYKGVTFSITPY